MARNNTLGPTWYYREGILENVVQNKSPQLGKSWSNELVVVHATMHCNKYRCKTRKLHVARLRYFFLNLTTGWTDRGNWKHLWLSSKAETEKQPNQVRLERKVEADRQTKGWDGADEKQLQHFEPKCVCICVCLPASWLDMSPLGSLGRDPSVGTHTHKLYYQYRNKKLIQPVVPGQNLN